MKKIKQIMDSPDENNTAVIRVARLANAIAFAERAYLDGLRDPKHVRARQTKHAMFLLGGYLYEAIHLVDQLADRYGRLQCFGRLMYFSALSRKAREIVAEFNFNPAFSLDWGGGTTKQQVGEDPIDVLDMQRQCHRCEQGHVFFPNVYKLDFDWLAKATEKTVSKADLSDTIKHDFPQLVQAYLQGAVEFVNIMTRTAMSVRAEGDEPIPEDV